MKRPAKDAISSDDSSDSDSDKDNKFGLPIKTSKSEGELVRKAESYQQYMKLIPVPSSHSSSSFIPFTTWQGLGNSLKKLYKQPLHYLTNRQLARWDRHRESGDDDASVPLDDIIDPRKAEAVVWKKKLAFDALSKHGYRGGPSVLKVPAPKEPEHEPDWSWSTGKDQNTPQNADDKTEESFEERERTRAALVHGEKLDHVQTKKDKERNDSKSFNQKEKRKRDLGQASRGKNYVEEEKRLLRESGVYSGFDA